jgi:citronellol/citronellal dehydrogenase
VVDNIERSIPAGRTGRPEELAWLVAYLASPAGDYFSGTTITIDGARDNWAGPWPPESIATAGGASVAEERRPKA